MNVCYRDEAGEKNQQNTNQCPCAIKHCVPIEATNAERRARSLVRVEVDSSRHWRDDTFGETFPEYIREIEIGKIALSHAVG